MLTITEIFAARVQQAEDRAQPDRYGEWPGMPSCLQELGAYLVSRNMLGDWRHSNRFYMTVHELQDMSKDDRFVGPGCAFAHELLVCQQAGGDPMALRFSIKAYEAAWDAVSRKEAA